MAVARHVATPAKAFPPRTAKLPNIGIRQAVMDNGISRAKGCRIRYGQRRDFFRILCGKSHPDCSSPTYGPPSEFSLDPKTTIDRRDFEHDLRVDMSNLEVCQKDHNQYDPE